MLLAFAVLPSISLHSQSFRTLHTFTGSSDGGYPKSGVILTNNTLYGTAFNGGPSSRDGGTVYAVNTDGTAFQVVFAFFTTEEYPSGDVVIADNILYTTGGLSDGAIIEVALDGS